MTTGIEPGLESCAGLGRRGHVGCGPHPPWASTTLLSHTPDQSQVVRMVSRLAVGEIEHSTSAGQKFQVGGWVGDSRVLGRSRVGPELGPRPAWGKPASTPSNARQAFSSLLQVILRGTKFTMSQ